jgi:hypothetical protein
MRLQRKTLAKGVKRDARELRSFISNDIEKEKRKFGFFKLMCA